MKRRNLVVLAVALTFTSGCMATSLRTVDAARRVTEPRLFGSWRGAPAPAGQPLLDETYWEPDGEWTIAARSRGMFRAVQRQEDGSETIYAGAVIRVGGRMFLDLEPDSLRWATCSAFPLLPVHAFASLDFVGDTLVVGYLRSDWLSAAASKKELSAGTQIALTEDDEVLLTGGAPEIEKLLTVAARDRSAFSIGKLVHVR